MKTKCKKIIEIKPKSKIIKINITKTLLKYQYSIYKKYQYSIYKNEKIIENEKKIIIEEKIK